MSRGKIQRKLVAMGTQAIKGAIIKGDEYKKHRKLQPLDTFHGHGAPVSGRVYMEQKGRQVPAEPIMRERAL